MCVGLRWRDVDILGDEVKTCRLAWVLGITWNQRFQLMVKALPLPRQKGEGFRGQVLEHEIIYSTHDYTPASNWYSLGY